MKKISSFVYSIALLLICGGAMCRASISGPTQEWLRENYSKREVFIPARDGVRLHTSVYEPTDSLPHPVIMIRTPYGIGPYGEEFAGSLGSWMRMFSLNRYIIVFQSVRGTFLSEGDYENIRPLKPVGSEWSRIDEATDTFDTVEWLLRHTRTNGAVGVKGVSYPGFYATLAALCGHPAVKAVSPQAPVTDWWRGDDVHHNGVWMLDTYPFAASFFRVRKGPSADWPESLISIDSDIYSYYMQFPDFQSMTANLGERVPFWEEMLRHPDYDSWWQERNVAARLHDVRPAMLVVGGSYDAEDCYGAIETYAAIRRQSPDTDAYFAYGPWSHGGWNDSEYTGLGGSYFGEGSSDCFMEEIEYPFFAYYLEGKGPRPAPVYIIPSRALDGSAGFDAASDLTTCSEWPPERRNEVPLYLNGDKLSKKRPCGQRRARQYVSAPSDPVPYMDSITNRRDECYMAADQRFIDGRKDVLTYRGAPLKADLLAEGPVPVHLMVSLSTTDADLIVKIIDERPDGYQMLVRGDVFRARYRHSLTEPKPVTPGERTAIDFTLNDIAHIFQKGHRIVVQIQSTWFPLMAISPQFFQDNPYTVPASDYRPCEIKVWNDSRVCLPCRSLPR